MLLALTHGLVSQRDIEYLYFRCGGVCNYALPDGIECQIIANYAHSSWRKLTELLRRTRAPDKTVLASQQCNGKFNLVVSHLHKTDRIVARRRILPRDRIYFCLHTIFSLGYLGHRKGFSLSLKCCKIHEFYQKHNIIAVSRGVLKDIRQTEVIDIFQFRRYPPASRDAL